VTSHSFARIQPRYHKTTAKAESIELGKIYAYDINLRATRNVFKRGHWTRLAISSNNFPRFNRNSNTGLPILGSRRMGTARQKIYHETKHPSVVVLPIISALTWGYRSSHAQDSSYIWYETRSH